MGAQQRSRPTSTRRSTLPARRRTSNSDGSLDSNGPGFQIGQRSTPFYLNGIGLAGQNGFPKGLVNNDYKTLQPRVGFSEDLFGNGKTVLRGGFGTFYERLQGNESTTLPPRLRSLTTRARAASIFTTPTKSWVTGLTAATPFFATGITNIRIDLSSSRSGQFSLGVQHELKPSVIWVVQYVGNMAWHQNIDRHINTFPINTDLNIRCNDR